jgi:hypothetical protein
MDEPNRKELTAENSNIIYTCRHSCLINIPVFKKKITSELDSQNKCGFLPQTLLFLPYLHVGILFMRNEL